MTTEWWQSHAPSTHCELGTPLPKKRPEELRFPPRSLGYQIQFRTRHGEFHAHHERFQHEDAFITCS